MFANVNIKCMNIFTILRNINTCFRLFYFSLLFLQEFKAAFLIIQTTLTNLSGKLTETIDLIFSCGMWPYEAPN